MPTDTLTNRCNPHRGDLRDAEVDQLHGAGEGLGLEDKVGQLDVAVHHETAVDELQRQQHVHRQLGHHEFAHTAGRSGNCSVNRRMGDPSIPPTGQPIAIQMRNECNRDAG